MREAPLLEAQPRIAQPHLYFRHKVLIESCPPRPQALGADGLPETPRLPLGARVCVRQVRPVHQDKDIVSAVQTTAMKNYLRAPRNRSDVKKILCVCVCVCVEGLAGRVTSMSELSGTQGTEGRTPLPHQVRQNRLGRSSETQSL